MTTTIEICNRASLRLGGEAITALDSSPSAALAASLFESIYTSELASYPWNFATKIEFLNQRVKKNSLYDFTYSLPSDILRLIRLFDNAGNDITDFKVVASEIWTNYDQVSIEYCAYTPINRVPQYFAIYLEYLLTAQLAIPLTDQTNKATLYQQLAERQLLNATYIDSQSQNQSAIDLTLLTNARI